jgi:hypothetical protein
VKSSRVWKLAKLIEGLGLLVVLVGVFWSIRLGFEDRGLESMGFEFRGLVIGGALFVIGWLLERAVGR